MTNQDHIADNNNTELDNHLGSPTSMVDVSEPSFTHKLKAQLRQGSMAVMAAISSLTPSATTVGTVAGAGALATVTQSCETDKPVDPINEDKELTAEDLEFAGIFDVNNPKMAKLLVTSILDGEPVVSIPVSPVPNNKAFTEAFKNFMDIELRLVDAKARTYSITPIINKSSVEKILKVAEGLNPGQKVYFMGILSEAISSSGVKRSLTGGISVADRDDNNPATPTPYLAQLPKRFTLEELEKFNPYTSLKSKTFNLNETEALRIGLAPSTIGQEFDAIYYPVNPSTEAVSISNQTGN